MTNLQAIDLLKGLEQSLDDYCELNDEGKTAFRMGITALELFGNSEQLPPAQPEPHEGHWIGSDGSYICSECNGSPIDFIDTMGISFDAYIGTLMNYCPNCGAKMRGEQHETD